MHLSVRKKIVLAVLVLIAVTSLELYAHTYVQIDHLLVVAEDEAIHSFPFGRSTGTYIFSSTSCQWLVVWRADEASTSMNYGFISIFKIGQNRSLFTLSTDLMVIRLEPKSNHTGWFSAELDAVLYERNRIDARISYHFGEKGIY